MFNSSVSTFNLPLKGGSISVRRKGVNLSDYSIKDQLRKMDETFNDDVVDFSYTTKTGVKQHIETLEVLEYGDEKLGIQPAGQKYSEFNVAEPENESFEKINPIESNKGLHLVVRDNQTNISYKILFGQYLTGASQYTIRDPYIRLPYQFRNFIELCRLIAELKPNDTEVKIHLVTNNNEEYLENSRESFAELIYSLVPLGIDLSYDFSEIQHDRSIEMNNGWKIILGRGLDIWQKTTGRYDIAEYYQEKRLCKEFEITVIENK